MDRLKAIGAEPPIAVQASAPTKPAGAPVCPVHNKPMKESSYKPGTYYCPKRLDDGGYCKSKA